MSEQSGDFKDAVHAARMLMGMTNAAIDQAKAMTDEELGRLLLGGRWTTVEVHEAGRRLATKREDG